MDKPVCPTCNSNSQVWPEYVHVSQSFYKEVNRCHRFGCDFYKELGDSLLIKNDWPRSRGTTQGELIRMHQESEAHDSKPPKHYDLGGGKDIHDIERAIWGDEAHAKHLLMAAFEYIARAHKKGSNIEDISKAINCIEKAKRIMTESGK